MTTTYINTGQSRSVVNVDDEEIANILIIGPEGALFDATDSTDNQVYVRDPLTGGLGDPSTVARFSVYANQLTAAQNGYVCNIVSDGTATSAEARLELELVP